MTKLLAILILLIYSCNKPYELHTLQRELYGNIVYLEFYGCEVHSSYWISGQSSYMTPAKVSQGQIDSIYKNVKNNFKGLPITITTNKYLYDHANPFTRVKIIITDNSQWYGNVGGVAYLKSFHWGDDTPAFVFSGNLGNDVGLIARNTSHEIGHTLGLYHQSVWNDKCVLTNTYNPSAIMGSGYEWISGYSQLGCDKKQMDWEDMKSFLAIKVNGRYMGSDRVMIN